MPHIAHAVTILSMLAAVQDVAYPVDHCKDSAAPVDKHANSKLGNYVRGSHVCGGHCPCSKNGR